MYALPLYVMLNDCVWPFLGLYMIVVGPFDRCWPSYGMLYDYSVPLCVLPLLWLYMIVLCPLFPMMLYDCGWP